MKKNKMMRTASGLLIATLLTTGITGGTFAKYTTEDRAGDTARVAKWGVTALVSGSLYGHDYNKQSETRGNEISATTSENVHSTDPAKNIVAPGTQNTTGLKIAISGKPEVANAVTVSRNDPNTKFKDICLKAGTYATLVKAENITEDNFSRNDPLYEANGAYATVYAPNKEYYKAHDIVTLVKDYYPIEYSLKFEDGAPAAYRELSAVYREIAAHFNSGKEPNKANTDIAKNAVVTWKWAIEQGGDDAAKKNNSGADTILGNIQAKGIVVKYIERADGKPVTEINEKGVGDYCLTTDFDVKLTVTQVD